MVRIVAVNLSLVAAVLIAAELLFGGWFGRENWGTLVIPKNVERRFDVDDLYGGGTITFTRDRYGLRGAYDDPGRIDILTIGGSTTNEIFLDDGQTWSAVLAREFERAGKPMVVVNAGVDGQSTVGHLKNFELWFPRIPNLKPRYVLAFIGINDTGRHLEIGRVESDRRSSSKQDRMLEARRPWKQTLLNNSALYTLFRNIRGMLRARNARLIHGTDSFDGSTWKAPQTPPDIDATARRWSGRLAEYAARLKEFAKRIRAIGAEPIFATQHWPSYRIRDGRVLGYVDAKSGSVALPHYALLMAHNRVTMEVCEDIRGICINLARDITFDDGDHYDGLHTSPRGSEKIGRYLHHRLAEVLK